MRTSLPGSPGRVRLGPLSLDAIDELARIAVIIHGTPVDDDHRPRPYEFWAPPDLEVPGWTSQPELWQRAIDVFTRAPPPTHQGLVHRDFHPGNILWEGDRITGVIDWAETSWGPADLDVMHSRTNFAMLHDVDSAVAFSNAYRWHGGILDNDQDAGALLGRERHPGLPARPGRDHRRAAPSQARLTAGAGTRAPGAPAHDHHR